jgi:hypothetical protein
LPLYYQDKKTDIDKHIISDIELIESSEGCLPLYEIVFDSSDIFGKQLISSWAKHFSTDEQYLQNTQSIIEQSPDEYLYSEDNKHILNVTSEIANNTNFKSEFHFIDLKLLDPVNENADFLQASSMYLLISPLIVILMPLVLLFLPFIIMRVKGIAVTITSYCDLLQVYLKRIPIGLLLNFRTMSWPKRAYAVLSVCFYFFQIYNNICTFFTFNSNTQKQYTALGDIRKYINRTILVAQNFLDKTKLLETYTVFNNDVIQRIEQLNEIVKMMSHIPDGLTHQLSKMRYIGYIRKCYYFFHKDSTFHELMLYTFGFNGFINNLSCIYKHVHSKLLGKCQFSKTKCTEFKKAFFAPLVKLNDPIIKNSYSLKKNVLITGPNAAGKTTLLKTTLFNVLLSQQIGYGYYSKARINLFSSIFCYINIPDTSNRDSLFQAEARRCKEILDSIESSSEHCLCVFDELFSGTNPTEATNSAFAYLSYLAKKKNVSFCLTTHFTNLCERLSDSNSNIENCSMLIDDDFKYTYKFVPGISYVKGGANVLNKLHFPKDIVKYV